MLGYKMHTSLMKMTTILLVIMVTVGNSSHDVHSQSIATTDVADEIKFVSTQPVIEKLKNFQSQRKEILKDLSPKSSGSENQIILNPSELNQVTYTGTTSNYHTPEYVFKIAESSKIKITPEHVSTTSKVIDYILFRMDSSGEMHFYTDGDELPAGIYSFVVTTSEAELVDYRYILSGIHLSEPPDTVLPKVTFNNPFDRVERVSSPVTNITISGNTDSYSELILNDGKLYPLSSSFNHSFPLKKGTNSIEVRSVRPSGNTLYNEFHSLSLDVTRIVGKDNYEISANVAKHLPSSSTILLARGDLFTDGLSGSSIAGLYQAPLLLTETEKLPLSVENEIKRRKPSQAIILGGVGSVSPQVEARLRELNISKITRFDGPNRFSVSADVATHLNQSLDTKHSDTAIIASGLIFSDVASASSVAHKEMLPMLLVGTQSIPAEIKHFIETNPRVKNYVIVGGPATVSESVETELKETYGKNVARISGANRFEVGVNIADTFKLDERNVVITNGVGTAFADALVGAQLASSLSPMSSPLLLSTPTTLQPSISNYMSKISGINEQIYIVGNNESVFPEVEEKLKGYLK
ncbi:cell wall-binding repeat-containing protein [Hazenella sp. IB182353]|uniref:cell wall-binding repeat-containing protein n=1 Tax=Polycladospora coralii TaxID=2771432 RepID=UPI001745D40A|nr:cell wall-binding repeat-containing protein [Polycladospora coralii]MBS7531391.1 cell wall-binding repeat-containing protein [Polycladospora coralii]